MFTAPSSFFSKTLELPQFPPKKNSECSVGVGIEGLLPYILETWSGWPQLDVKIYSDEIFIYEIPIYRNPVKRPWYMESVYICSSSRSGGFQTLFFLVFHDTTRGALCGNLRTPLKVFKPFFIEMRLPYAAVRGFKSVVLTWLEIYLGKRLGSIRMVLPPGFLLETLFLCFFRDSSKAAILCVGYRGQYLSYDEHVFTWVLSSTRLPSTTWSEHSANSNKFY